MSNGQALTNLIIILVVFILLHFSLRQNLQLFQSARVRSKARLKPAKGTSAS